MVTINVAPLRSERALLPAKMGMWLFLCAEVMFFSGLISAFLVFRLSYFAWPPADQPRLPVWATAANTLVLILSGVMMNLAVGAVKKGKSKEFTRYLLLTLGLGIVFLAVQGTEWVRLVGFGLTLTSSIYGGLFYVLIGTHALHVLGAVVSLIVVNKNAMNGKYSAESYVGLDLCRIYWNFVVGIWPLLYVLVYLS